MNDHPTEIEVIDPTHPLYGRRFILVSLSNPPQGPRQAMVVYQKDILLRIPASATNLAAEAPRIDNSKVSFDSLYQLINLAKKLGVIAKKAAENE